MTKKLIVFILAISFLLSGCFGKGKEKSITYENLLESAQKLAKNENYDLAADLCKQTINMYPKETQPYLDYFSYIVKVKDIKISDEIDYIQTMIMENQKDKMNSTVNEAIATYFLQQKDYYKAYYYYCLVKNEESETAQLYKELSLSLASGNTGDLQKALDAIISDTDKQKNNEEKVEEYRSLYITIRSLDIEDSVALNVLEKASASAKKIYDKNPDYMTYVELEQELAEKYFELKDTTKAKSHYELVYTIDSENKEVMEILGQLYIEGAQTEKAIQIYEKLVTLDSQNISFQSKYATLLLKEELTKAKEQRDFSKILGIYSNLKLKEASNANEDFNMLKDQLNKNNLLN